MSETDQLYEFTKHHVDSYNQFITNLSRIAAGFPVFEIPFGESPVFIKIISFSVTKPEKERNDTEHSRFYFPRDCRLRGITYRGRLYMTFQITHNSIPQKEVAFCGFIPICVNSDLCSTKNLSNNQKICIGEDVREGGGYYIINGNEKLYRLTINSRRNLWFGNMRPLNATKGPNFTKYAVTARCMAPDETGSSNILFYLHDGSVVLKFFIYSQGYYVPLMLILKALVDCTDEEIFNLILAEDFTDNSDTKNETESDKTLKSKRRSNVTSFESGNGILNQEEKKNRTSNFCNLRAEKIKRVRNLLLEFDRTQFSTQKDVLLYLGSKFKSALTNKKYSSAECTLEVFRRYICPHLDDHYDKFMFLIHGVRRLYHLVDTERFDDPDIPSSQEVMTVTQLFSTIIKDKVYDMFSLLKRTLDKKPAASLAVLVSTLKEKTFMTVGNFIEKTLASGRVNITHTSDRIDREGNSIAAERINFLRYISHFRVVNRGNFFAQIKTTSVRKLKPESFGFLCPVHTPDGTPCGIITHLAHKAVVTVQNQEINPGYFVSIGMLPLLRGQFIKNSYEVLVDGKICGYVPDHLAKNFVISLRRIRSQNNLLIEVVLITKDSFSEAMYPAIYVFTTRGRLMRPLCNDKGELEYVGTLEQVFLHVKRAQHASFVKDNSNVLDSYKKLLPMDISRFSENGKSNSHLNSDDSFTASVYESRKPDSENFKEKNSQSKYHTSNACIEAENLIKNLNLLINQSLNIDITHFSDITHFKEKIFRSLQITIENRDEFERKFQAMMNSIVGKFILKEILEKNVIEISNPIYQGNTLFPSYSEISSSYFMSLVANLTPYSDYNQSPRNMYQCQMAKQTMGTAYINHSSRSDNKSYKILYPQGPLVRTKTYKRFGLDDYPMGINAIVAVISYTAYDMEDAMVINKYSMNRGFFHGTVYKAERIDLGPNEYLAATPLVGSTISPGDPFYRIKKENGDFKTILFKFEESAVVDSVRMFPNQNATLGYVIILRMERNPSIGDKFCSRHGQKGVCSNHWAMTDMPFTEDGIVPDIIINPHAFPSRMTIGMLIESMAAKVACLRGKKYDGSPFQSEKHVDLIGPNDIQLIQRFSGPLNTERNSQSIILNNSSSLQTELTKMNRKAVFLMSKFSKQYP